MIRNGENGKVRETERNRFRESETGVQTEKERETDRRTKKE